MSDLESAIARIPVGKNPDGWIHVANVAVGGLLAVGFSLNGPYLLVVSTAGRGVVNCDSGEKVDRDYEMYAGLDHHKLHCQGIGILQNEVIALGGIWGGGLPLQNSAGECLELISPDWPEDLVIFCGKDWTKTIYNTGAEQHCKAIYKEYDVKAYGFSWCGNYIVCACSSDFDIWKREMKVTASVL